MLFFNPVQSLCIFVKLNLETLIETFSFPFPFFSVTFSFVSLVIQEDSKYFLFQVFLARKFEKRWWFSFCLTRQTHLWINVADIQSFKPKNNSFKEDINLARKVPLEIFLLLNMKWEDMGIRQRTMKALIYQKYWICSFTLDLLF